MKTLVSALAVASLAGSAFGFTEIGPRGNFNFDTIDRVNYLGDITSLIEITATPIDGEVSSDRGTVEYSNMTLPAGGNLAATSTPASPVVGVNDYQFALDGASAFDTPLVNPVYGIDTMRFVGGSVAAGGKMDFFFLQNDSTTATAFTITFAAAGNFIYSFNVGTIPGGVYIPQEGYLVTQKNATSPSEVRQFYSFSQPTVGKQNTANDFVFAYGGSIGNQPISERWEFQIPAPGATALMGLAGLVGLRRRR